MEQKIKYEFINADNQYPVVVQKERLSKIPCGVYKTGFLDNIFSLFPVICNSDQYLELNHPIILELQKNIQSFIELKEKYTKLHLLHKRGILLYGPPGNGKSMMIHHFVDQFKDKCYIIYVESPYEIKKLYQLRDLFTGNLTFFIFEELTEHANSRYISDFLNFLDGPDSWDDAIIIATTNYPGKLPGNIINRPSRFDLILKFDNPPEIVRRKYLEQLVGQYPEEIIALTKNYSLAYLKELCIQSILKNQGLLETHLSLEKMRKEIRECISNSSIDEEVNVEPRLPEIDEYE